MAAAQTGTDGTEAPASTTEPAPESAPDPLNALRRVLEDPAARALLVEQLKALEAAGASPDAGERGAIGETPPEPIAVEEPPTLFGPVKHFVQRQFRAAAEFATNATDINRFWGWITIQSRSEQLSNYWIGFLTGLALCLGGAAAIYVAEQMALYRVRRAVSRKEPQSTRQKFLYAAAAAGLDLAPLASFAAVGGILLLFIHFPRRTDLVAESIFWTVAAALSVIWAARVVLRPDVAPLRLLRIPDDSARDVYRRIVSVTLWLSIGIAFFHNVGRLGVPEGIFDGIERIWGLIIAVLLVFPLVKYRAAISGLISGEARIRRFLAAIWLPVVIVYAAGTFIIWATNVHHAFNIIAQGGIVTLLVLLAIQPLSRSLKRLVDRSLSEAEDVWDPVLVERLERYLPFAGRVITVLIYTAAAIVIGLAWGQNSFDVLSGILANAFTTTAANIVAIFVICWLIWEVTDVAFRLFLRGEIDDSGRKVERSARSRTLVPLFRTVIVILLLLGFIGAVLNSFGLDIAPLLATAGIAGIAIGFGAQKLVQDVITGLFMIFQDTISVGDIVELSGVAGTVERITIRTIELRDLEGNLHTIPFSAVNTVKNMTRDFSHAMMDIGIAYRENADHVMEVLRHIGAELENNPTHGPNILAAIEVLGVQDLADSAVIIRCRFKVMPQTQWAVRRAFLALVKKRFDELGIEIPFPQRTLHYAAPYEQPAFASNTKTHSADGTGDA